MLSTNHPSLNRSNRPSATAEFKPAMMEPLENRQLMSTVWSNLVDFDRVAFTPDNIAPPPAVHTLVGGAATQGRVKATDADGTDGWYRIELGHNAKVSLKTGKLKEDYNLELRNANGDLIGRSNHEGRHRESIKTMLPAGEYFARVVPASQSLMAPTHYTIQASVHATNREVPAPQPILVFKFNAPSIPFSGSKPILWID